jgi:hypothetical protein
MSLIAGKGKPSFARWAPIRALAEEPTASYPLSVVKVARNPTAASAPINIVVPPSQASAPAQAVVRTLVNGAAELFGFEFQLQPT